MSDPFDKMAHVGQQYIKLYEGPKAPSMTGPPCEVCGKPTESEGRRCCPGLSECWRILHERDQFVRHATAIRDLLADYANNPYRDRYEEQQKAIVAAFEEGRKF